MLSAHFSFEELTQTSNTKLQEVNRAVAEQYLPSLKSLAGLLEVLRKGLGYPLDIHSGFRCPELNGATMGSVSTSQHTLGEACDFSPYGDDNEDSIEDCFARCQKILKEAKQGFGQLIMESADREHGVALWLHISLGAPWRKMAKCGQVMIAKNGIYQVLRTIEQANDGY
jgi:hypothetical protein